MALVRARHKVFGVCEVGELTVATYPDDWTRVDPSTPTAAERRAAGELEDALAGDGDLFDPADENVEEVIAHLATADEPERIRVLELERIGKKRSTVLGFQPPA